MPRTKADINNLVEVAVVPSHIHDSDEEREKFVKYLKKDIKAANLKAKIYRRKISFDGNSIDLTVVAGYGILDE